MRDKVTRQCPQTTTFEEKGEQKRVRTEVPLLTSLTPYRYAKPVHEGGLSSASAFYSSLLQVIVGVPSGGVFGFVLAGSVSSSSTLRGFRCFLLLSPPGDRRCAVLGFVLAGSVSSSSTLKGFGDCKPLRRLSPASYSICSV